MNAEPGLLIADDDESQRWTLRAIFEPAGFQVYTAGSGEEALDVAEAHAFDCLLFDLNMPGISGLETFQLLCQRSAPPPCVLLTSETSPELLKRALSLRIYTVLSKPVSRQLVTHSVRRAILAHARSH